MQLFVSFSPVTRAHQAHGWTTGGSSTLPPMLNSAELRGELHELSEHSSHIPVTVIHFLPGFPTLPTPHQWFCRAGLSPCVHTAGCFDKDKKWVSIAQEVTWALLAASEGATSIWRTSRLLPTFPGKDRKWLCSAFQEAGHPLSLSSLISEGLFWPSRELGRSSQKRNVSSLEDLILHLSLICAQVLPSGGICATGQKSTLFVPRYSSPPEGGNPTSS